MYARLVTADGSTTLVHPVHGEACHSSAGAWTQARERYAAECRLAGRAAEIGAAGGGALCLLDVGTGLGFNLAAALASLEGTGVALDAVSLESERGVLECALEGTRQPADLERWHAPVRKALHAALADAERAAVDGVPLGDAGRLFLHVGDARERLLRLDAAPRFDAVFLDPFSPRVEPELWAPEFLAEVARRMARGSRLATYSAATAVRAALLCAGLGVGRGARVGRKREGTLASPDAPLPPLDRRALARAQRRARAWGWAGPAPGGFAVQAGTSPGPML